MSTVEVTCNIWRRYDRERAPQSLPKNTHKFEKKKLENAQVQELRQETTELRASAHELALAQDEARRSQMSVEELKVTCWAGSNSELDRIFIKLSNLYLTQI